MKTSKDSKATSISKASAATECGGGPARGNLRHARYFRRKTWMHIVLRSRKAKGSFGLRLPRHWQEIERIRKQAAADFDIQVAQSVNTGNMLQFRVRSAKRENLQNFLRVMTCLVARSVTGARKGKPFGRFWEGLAYSRIMTDSRSLTTLQNYLQSLIRESTDSRASIKLLNAFESWRIAPPDTRTATP